MNLPLILRRSLWALLILLLAAMLATALGGCSVASGSLKELETGRLAGTFNGQAVDIGWKRATDGTTTFDINVPLPAASSAPAIGGMLGGPLGTVIGTGIAAIATAWGASQKSRADGEKRRADFHEEDSRQGWQKADENAKQAQAYALQVAPPLRDS